MLWVAEDINLLHFIMLAATNVWKHEDGVTCHKIIIEVLSTNTD
jgi:hypothetical protein